MKKIRWNRVKLPLISLRPFSQLHMTMIKCQKIPVGPKQGLDEQIDSHRRIQAHNQSQDQDEERLQWHLSYLLGHQSLRQSSIQFLYGEHPGDSFGYCAWGIYNKTVNAQETRQMSTQNRPQRKLEEDDVSGVKEMIAKVPITADHVSQTSLRYSHTFLKLFVRNAKWNKPTSRQEVQGQAISQGLMPWLPALREAFQGQ